MTKSQRIAAHLSVIVLAPLSSPSAFGQMSSREATETEITWRKAHALLEEDLENIREHMGYHGEVFTDLEKLRAYVEQSQQEIEDAARASARRACTDRAALESDQELLINAYKQVEADEAAALERVVERLPEVLGEPDASVFQHLVTHFIHMKGLTIEMDPAERVRSGKADVDQLCGLGDAPFGA